VNGSEQQRSTDQSPEPRRSATLPGSSLDLLEKYRWDAQYLSAGHYLAAKRYYTYSTRLGVITIAASAITSTSVFASLATNPSIAWKIATGILAAAGATFASLQTFLKFSERSDRHKQYGARFIEIRDRADTLLIQLTSTADRKPVTLLGDAIAVADLLSKTAAEAPDLPNRDYDVARATFHA
jgi:SMODS and SLOG-associating 2TM effector domain family 4